MFPSDVAEPYFIILPSGVEILFPTISLLDNL